MNKYACYYNVVNSSYNILHSGIEIPPVGLGVWKMPNNDNTVDAIKAAIKSGYRHIDTASVYKNEESIGLALKESGVPRKDMFITKLAVASEFNISLRSRFEVFLSYS